MASISKAGNGRSTSQIQTILKFNNNKSQANKIFSFSLSLSLFHPLSFKIGLNTCANTKDSLSAAANITHSKFIQLISSKATTSSTTTQCIHQIQPCTYIYSDYTHTHLFFLSQSHTLSLIFLTLSFPISRTQPFNP